MGNKNIRNGEEYCEIGKKILKMRKNIVKLGRTSDHDDAWEITAIFFKKLLLNDLVRYVEQNFEGSSWNGVVRVYYNEVVQWPINDMDIVYQ